jgi:uncharacterized membrane protein
MSKWITAYLSTAGAIAVGDFIWLGFLARDFYRNQLGQMMLEQPYWPPALAFYLLYAFGVVFFAVAPALSSGSWATALVSGLVLGLVAYATYDLSNYATLKGWPTTMVFVDIAWGAALTGFAATVGFFATRAIAGD